MLITVIFIFYSIWCFPVHQLPTVPACFVFPLSLQMSPFFASVHKIPSSIFCSVGDHAFLWFLLILDNFYSSINYDRRFAEHSSLSWQLLSFSAWVKPFHSFWWEIAVILSSIRSSLFVKFYTGVLCELMNILFLKFLFYFFNLSLYWINFLKSCIDSFTSWSSSFILFLNLFRSFLTPLWFH